MLTIVLPGARDCESEWAGSRPPLWLPTPSTKRARRHTRQDGAALTRDPWLNTCHGESPVSQPIHALEERVPFGGEARGDHVEQAPLDDVGVGLVSCPQQQAVGHLDRGHAGAGLAVG